MKRTKGWTLPLVVVIGLGVGGLAWGAEGRPSGGWNIFTPVIVVLKPIAHSFSRLGRFLSGSPRPEIYSPQHGPEKHWPY